MLFEKTNGENPKNKRMITAVLTLLSAVLMGLLIALVYTFNVPNPNMILISAMVLFTGLGGMIPGAASVVLMLVYSMFFSEGHSFVRYSEVNLQKMWIIILGIVINYFVVGLLKRRHDRTQTKLHAQNRVLEEETKAANTLAEVSKSVTSLLTNIPALTFSKDIETGKYLACNQLFAEYAHKSSPEGVVGLTDFDIFDRDTALHFVEDDRRALSMDEPYIFYEDVPDAVGNPRHFQTTKQKFTDTYGRLCTLGLCVDVTELVNMKRETLEAREAYEKASRSSSTYSGIAKALSSDYSYLYSLDLDTEEFIEYTSDPARDMLAVERRGSAFFETCRRAAAKILYPEDQAQFVQAFTKENVIKGLKAEGKFILYYRTLSDGSPVHMRMKAKWLDETKNQIIIGIINVESEVRQQEDAERIRKERLTYARLTALSGDYLVLFTVESATDHYLVYSTSSIYDGLGFARTGENFFTQMLLYAPSIVYPEDLELFREEFSKERVTQGIMDSGVFVMQYRILFDGEPIWVNLKAAQVEENGSKKLIIGVNNVDAQIRRETEYEHTLAVTRAMARRDALTGVKNRMAYLETEREIDSQIAVGTPEPFALILFDVNNLKVVNDQKGHRSGDEYLRSACRIICNVFKHSPVFRIGGDEFAAIARGQDDECAEELLSQLETINQKNLGTELPVVAAGFARYAGERSMAELFQKADAEMYAEKNRLKLPTEEE